jgi:formylmethanofuran dehydrogenase subunit B
MVTPNARARLRAIRERGGKLVTVDPRFTETAKLADEHVFLKPGGDAALLLAMLQTMVPGTSAATRRTTASGWDESNAARPFTPKHGSMTGVRSAH